MDGAADTPAEQAAAGASEVETVPFGGGLLDHQHLVSVMPDPAVVVDADGTIVCANGLVASLFGYQPHELIGQPVETLVPERRRHPHRQHRRGYTAAPRVRAMGEGLELFGRRKDGTEIPVDISLAPLPADVGMHVLAAIRDVSALKAATASQAHLGAIVQSSLDGIISMTLDGFITSWNPGAEQVLGYAATDAVGQHVSRLLTPQGSEALEILLASASAGSSAGALDTVWVHASGRQVDVAISVSGISETGKGLTGYSAIVRDVSERKAAEAALHRLLYEEQQRERQQAATSEVRFAMLSGANTEDVLTLICEHTRNLFDIEMSVIGLVESGDLAVAAASGAGSLSPAEALRARSVDQVISTGEPLLVKPGPDAAAEEGTPKTVPVACAPINLDERVIGVLVALDGPVRQSDSLRLPVLEGMADQASMAMALGMAREDRERLVLVADRERIARDLHDIVIQRLFAAGMGLEASLRLIRDDQVVARVSSAIDDLDKTVRDIRAAIFELEPVSLGKFSIRSDILELARQAGERLGFQPSVHFEGPIDTAVSDDIRPHLLAVAREALSNAARRSHASSVTVAARVDANETVLVVSDDGVGIGDTDDVHESGLANMRERAEDLGGRFEIAGQAEGGTRLVWRVPR